MNGFIVMAIDKKKIQSLENINEDLIKCLPVMATSKQKVKSDLEENHPELLILSITSLKKMKSNIQLIESLAQQRGISIS